MTNETLYRAIGDIDEAYIAQAHTCEKPKRRTLARWGAVAAALLLLMGGAMLSNIIGGSEDGGGFFGNGDATVYAAHREDFTPDIENSILAQFDDPSEVKKAYLMRTNEWFLADNLTDFSQAVTTDVVYVVPGSKDGIDSDTAYSIYSVDEVGNIQWSCTAYPPDSDLVPFAFSGFTYPMIQAALATLEHEDYIITYAPQMGTVFIWVRNTAEGDVILAYPTRPDLLGLECGGVYTLHELQEALTKTYHDCHSEVRVEDHSHQNDRHHSATSSGTTTGHFIHSMDCSDPNCTNAAHFHDCPSDCNDGAHYHNCPTTCTIAAHGHPTDHKSESSNKNSSGHRNGHGNGHH